MGKNRLISIVAPMYNEGGLVEQFCRETAIAFSGISEYNYEILLVNDGSQDNTLVEMYAEQQKDPRHIAIVNLTRNFGLEGAVNAGLLCATGDAVVVMDADLQDPPSVILELVEKWVHGADVVVAVRKKRVNDTPLKRVGAGLFYGALDSLSGKIKIKRGAANFRLLSRRAVEMLNALPEANRVFRVTVPYIGMKTDYVEYTRDKRFAGKTKYSLKSMIPYALDSLTGISVEPLRKIPIAAVVSIVLMLASGAAAVLTSDVWRIGFAVCAVMSALFTALFICLAVIAEYVAQLTIEVKGRPVSLIYDYKPSQNNKGE